MYFPSLLPAVPVPEFPALSVPSMRSPALPPIPPATASAVVPPGQSAPLPLFRSVSAALPAVLSPAVRLGILCKIVLRCLIPNRLNTAAAVQVAAKCTLPECARLTDAVDKIVAFFMGMIPSLLRFSICPKSIGLAVDHTPPGHLISVAVQIARARIRFNPAGLTDTVHKEIILSIDLCPALCRCAAVVVVFRTPSFFSNRSVGF